MSISTLSRLLLTLLLCLALATPAFSQRRERADFRFVNRNDVITLDLNQMSFLQDFRVTFAIREGLFTYDPETMEAEPALAVSWTSSEDQRVWTFRLRPEARWSNGDPVTAHDFVFSWRHMLEAPGDYTSLFYYIRNAFEFQQAYAAGRMNELPELGFRAIDDHTLEVTLNYPVPFLFDLLAFPPFYPRHERSMLPFRNVDAMGRVSFDARYTRPAERPGAPGVVLNGPFVLERWDFGRSLFFRQNPYYWDRANVRSNTLEMVVNPNPNSAFIMYEQGQIDWITDPHPNIAVNLRQQGRTDLVTGPGFGTHFLTVNVNPSIPGRFERNPLADVRVRQALAMATDREQITRDITRMGERPATNYIPPDAFPDWNAAPGFGLDVERARALLAEAGFPEGRGLPVLPILFNTDSPVRPLVAQALRSQWERNLGIRVEAVGVELKGFRQQIRDQTYVLALVAWFGDYLDPSTFTDKYRSTSENNDSGWVVPEYDALLDRAAREIDPIRRRALLIEAENMINRELPIIPLWHAVSFTLRRDNVRGLYMNRKQLTMWKPVYVER